MLKPILKVCTALAALAVAFGANAQLKIERLSEYEANGGFDEGGTEIVAYDEANEQIFSTNGALNRIDVISIADPANPMLVDSLSVDSIGGINSVAVHGGLVVAAVANDNKQDNGYAVLFQTNGDYVGKLMLGALPDMVTFNNAGDQIIVACEGEPNDDYSNDPEGSIAVISVPAIVTDLGQYEVNLLTFNAWDAYYDELAESGVRLFGGSTPIAVNGWVSDNGGDVDTIVADLSSVPVQPELELVGWYEAGSFDEGATEIVSYDAINQHVFSTNGEMGRIDVIDISDVTAPELVDSLYIDSIGGGINSVAVYGDLVVAAVQAFSKQDPGFAVFFNTDGTYITKVPAGALPDMVTFTHDGAYAVLANEGEPNDDYSNDPEGSITIIEIPTNVNDANGYVDHQLDFNAFDALKAQLQTEGVRIFGGVEPQTVVSYQGWNGDDADSVEVADASNFAAGMFITLDSDNSDEDVDYVRAYQIDAIDGNTLILTTEFDFEYDGQDFVEGTDTSVAANMWTVYLMDKSATVSQDLEPEYVAINATNDTAFVTLQENNAVAVVDIANQVIVDVVALGVKDHSLEENAMDASNKDDEINITTHPTLGMYMPDAISSFESMGSTYYLTANEGDAREYDALIEESQVRYLDLDNTIFPDASTIQQSENTGRLRTTLLNGDSDMDGDFDEIYSYGARSFSVWDSEGNLLWDSGDELEAITAYLWPAEFNSTNDETAFDDRSDNKGPEPEAITTGVFKGVPYAFIGLERMGGIMVYDMSNPMAPEFVAYANTRDYAADPTISLGLAPESVVFVDEADSPSGESLLIVSNEVSGTVELYEVYDANEVMTGSWITLDSDNKNDDVDFVRTYQVADVDGDNIILTTAFDYDYDPAFIEGTDTSAIAADWTINLLNHASSVSEDLEPEYVAVAPDDLTAVVALQENNALAVVDLVEMEVIDIVALGFKDHSAAGNGLDADDKNGAILIQPLPVWGMYMPDAITSFEDAGSAYYLSANEGDAREYDGLIEEIKMGDLPLDATSFPSAVTLQENDSIGRLKSTIFDGDIDMDGDYDELYAYGARSFSVWDASGSLVWDSGDDFEQITAAEFPLYFNSTNDEAEIDNRSDNKGPEPEAVTTGSFDDTTYAFIGLERMGGFMVYDLEDPMDPQFVTYVNDRDYAAAPEEQGDLAPEDIKFIANGPMGKSLIIVSNEVSGTVSIYEVSKDVLIGIEENLASSISLYPNPASERINLMYNGNLGNASYSLTTVSGIEMRAEALASTQKSISLTGLENGIYVITISTEQGSVRQRIIVE